MAQQSAVEWLADKLMSELWTDTVCKKYIEHALEMNKHQHGNTWDAAIKAHDDRGHVHARSLVDFDEYFEETYKK